MVWIFEIYEFKNLKFKRYYKGFQSAKKGLNKLEGRLYIEKMGKFRSPSAYFGVRLRV